MGGANICWTSKGNSVQYLIFARFILAQRWPCLRRWRRGWGSRLECRWGAGEGLGSHMICSIAIVCCVGESVSHHQQRCELFLFDPGDSSFSIRIIIVIHTNNNNKLGGHTENHYKRPGKLQIDCWMFYWVFPPIAIFDIYHHQHSRARVSGEGACMQPNGFHSLARLINKYSSVPFHSNSRAGGRNVAPLLGQQFPISI